MRLVTANVWKELSDDSAKKALGLVLAKRPQIVALQEWGRGREQILRDAGVFTRLPRTFRRLRVWPPSEGYAFAAPLGGGPPVGVDAEWGEIIAVRTLLLAPKRLADRATHGVEAIIRERATGRVHPVLNIHLLAHHDDPAHLRGWNEARHKVEEWAESWTGYPRWVIGDVNKHLLDIPPLKSCWDRQQPQPTFGKHRTIDAIYGNVRSVSVDAFRIGSDHRAVVADYEDI
jgi:hypothetical protein